MNTQQLIDQQMMGQRLLAARKAMKLSRADVLRLTGIPKLSLTNYEEGNNAIPALRMKLLADTYGITYEWLLTGRDSQLESPEFQNAIASLLKAGELIGDAGRQLKQVK